MCICIYVHICVYIHVYIHTCIYADPPHPACHVCVTFVEGRLQRAANPTCLSVRIICISESFQTRDNSAQFSFFFIRRFRRAAATCCWSKSRFCATRLTTCRFTSWQRWRSSSSRTSVTIYIYTDMYTDISIYISYISTHQWSAWSTRWWWETTPLRHASCAAPPPSPSICPCTWQPSVCLSTSIAICTHTYTHTYIYIYIGWRSY